MQTTVSQKSSSGSFSATHVWDLDSAVQRRFTPRARTSPAGPIAASFGLAAFCAALAPSTGIETRLFFVVVFGSVSVLVGVSALRRRQTRSALVLAAVGAVAPAIAIVLVVLAATQAPARVTSSTVQRPSLQPDSSALVPTGDFASLSASERSTTRAFLTMLAAQIQTTHGPSVPLPHLLAVSNGVLVEGDGILQGTTLAALPEGENVVYQLASDGSAFRITVSSSSDPRATIWADRGLSR